jgi:hypothetical protein
VLITSLILAAVAAGATAVIYAPRMRKRWPLD